MNYGIAFVLAAALVALAPSSATFGPDAAYAQTKKSPQVKGFVKKGCSFTACVQGTTNQCQRVSAGVRAGCCSRACSN